MRLTLLKGKANDLSIICVPLLKYIVSNIMIVISSAMALGCELLLLLLPVLSQCGANEYYVRPTEPTNTSCPGQPCLTLNQYTNDFSHYFASDTVFKFLPGTHLMNRALEIRDIHNISLTGSNIKSNVYPQLVARFPCQYRPRSKYGMHMEKILYLVHA